MTSPGVSNSCWFEETKFVYKLRQVLGYLRRNMLTVKISRGSLLVAAVAILLTWSAKAHACACCADSGEWYERIEKISKMDFDEFTRFRFSPTARLLIPPGNTIKGLSQVSESYTYTLTVSPSRRPWSLEFKADQGGKGVLFLTPLTTESFGTDIFDGSEKVGLGPRLYKEWRFEGRVGGNGLFAKGITDDTKFRLIFQGRGNLCTMAEDFTHWKLQIFGRHASYAFYGALE